MIRDDLELRRAQREASERLEQLRALIDAYDAGEVDFSLLGCMADRVAAHLADIALSGVLA